MTKVNNNATIFSQRGLEHYIQESSFASYHLFREQLNENLMRAHYSPWIHNNLRALLYDEVNPTFGSRVTEWIHLWISDLRARLYEWETCIIFESRVTEWIYLWVNDLRSRLYDEVSPTFKSHVTKWIQLWINVCLWKCSYLRVHYLFLQNSVTYI